MQLNFIHNQSVASQSGQTLPVIDPSNGQTFDHIQRSNAQDIDLAVKSSRECFEGPWSKLNAAERGRLLMALSRKVAEHADELMQLEQRDCGKPTQQAMADARALARYFEFYAGACDKFHGETIPYQNGYSVLTWREPHGVTGHVVPWNYPMQIFGRCVGGALAAGNVCVVKPAEDACLSLIRVAQLAAEVGFPPGAINIVTGLGHEVGDALALITSALQAVPQWAPSFSKLQRSDTAQSPWNWVAKVHKSFLPMLTLMQPSLSSSMPLFKTQDKPAVRVLVCSLRKVFTSPCYFDWVKLFPNCVWGPQAPTSIWAPSFAQPKSNVFRAS
jgi:hypothetical protein